MKIKNNEKELDYDDVVVGDSISGLITRKIKNWEFKEVDCGPLGFTKQWDYKGNELDRDLKIEVIFFTNNGTYYGSFYFMGKLRKIIQEELKLNLKFQKGVICK